MDNKEFTLKDAFEVQAGQLAEFKTILNDKTYEIVYEICMLKNKGVDDPYKVFRGCEITSLVRNIALHNAGKGGINPYELFFELS